MEQTMSFFRNIIVTALLTVGFIYPLKATGIETIVGANVGAALAPIIVPLATKVLDKSLVTTESFLKELSKKSTHCTNLCYRGSKAICLTQSAISLCKSQCQKEQKLEAGYSLRIRYGTNPDWSLENCVKKGSKDKEVKNPKSIAVYGEKQLDTAKKRIATITALQEFVQTKTVTQGTILGKSIIELSQKEADKLIQRVHDQKLPGKMKEKALKEAQAEGKTLIEDAKKHATELKDPKKLKELTDEAAKDLNTLVKDFAAEVKRDFGPQ